MATPEEERIRYRADRGMRRRRLPNVWIGIGFAILALFGLYLAYTKRIPFTSHGYELEATFSNAVNMAPGTPVRIAGVTVGEVTELEPAGDSTKVRFTVTEEGQPVNSDAVVKIRPRMFFEGNYFLDLDPGSPSAPELEDGGSIPISQTATAVQFDEILTTLQEPSREDIGELLSGYGGGLYRSPTPLENIGFEPQIKGLSAAQALNEAFDYGEVAGRGGARVAEGFRGTSRNDLARMITASGRTFEALAAHERSLEDLITNWRVFTEALASESENLSATFAELAPTLEVSEESLDNLNRTLPALRGWARAFEPAVAELPATIAAAEPWLDQADPLLDRSEAGGLLRMLRRATPGLAGASAAGINTVNQIGLLSRCTSEVLVPTGDQVINDRFSTGQPNYTEFFYASANIAGESQYFDGNGPLLRLSPGIGDILVSTPNPTGEEATPGAPPPADKDDTTLWGHVSLPPLGTQPQFGPKPPFRPEVACHTNDVPNLNTGLGTAGPPALKVGNP